MINNKFKAKLTRGEIKNPSTYMPAFTQYELPQDNHDNCDLEKLESPPRGILCENFDGTKFSEQLYSRKNSEINHSTLECEPSYYTSTDPQTSFTKSKLDVDQNLSILEKIEEEEAKPEKVINEFKSEKKEKPESKFEILNQSLPQSILHSKIMTPKAYHNVLIMTEKSDKLSKVDESFSKVKLLKSIEADKSANKDDEVNVERRYCTYCHLEQPLRTKHCKLCKKCVLLFDHHCPWVGTCIGEKNRPFFFFFLITQGVEIGFWGLKIIFMIFNGELLEILKEDEIYLCLLMIVTISAVYLFFVLIVALLICQIYLAFKNLTTWEYLRWNQISYLKALPEELGSPFSLGTLRNLKIYFFPCGKDYREWKVSPAFSFYYSKQ